jgi:hypothetical protein
MPDSGTALADCTHFDAATVAGRPPVSFTNDLLPMFGLSCVTSDCHGSDAMKAGLYLGHKCGYDPNAKWKCTFPATAQGDFGPAPDDPQTISAIYASLLAPAQTGNDGSVQRVKPGDPANSFLVLSLANQQNARGYACTNQDPSHEPEPAPSCGESMPLNGDLWCDSPNVQAKFDAVVTWIAQGAPFN